MTISQRIRDFFNGDLPRNIYEIVALIFEQQDAVVWPAVISVSSGSYILSDTDNGKILLFTNAGGCTVTVPASLQQGFSVLMVQDSAGAVTLASSGGLSFVASAAVSAPYTTADQGSTLCVTKISSTRALVSGAVA